MAVGVLPQREGAMRTTSARSRPRGAQAVVVLHGELDGRHPIVVAAHIAHAVQPAGLPQAPGAELGLDVRHMKTEEVDDRGGGPEHTPPELPP